MQTLRCHWLDWACTPSPANKKHSHLTAWYSQAVSRYLCIGYSFPLLLEPHIFYIPLSIEIPIQGFQAGASLKSLYGDFDREWNVENMGLQQQWERIPNTQIPTNSLWIPCCEVWMLLVCWWRSACSVQSMAAQGLHVTVLVPDNTDIYNTENSVILLRTCLQKYAVMQ